MFNFLRKGQNVYSTVDVALTNNVISLLPHQCLQFSGFYVCLNCSHPRGCEVISHCSFYLHIPNGKWYSASLHVLTLHLYICFGEISIQVLWPFIVFLLLNFKSSLYVLITGVSSNI